MNLNYIINKVYTSREERWMDGSHLMNLEGWTRHASSRIEDGWDGIVDQTIGVRLN